MKIQCNVGHSAGHNWGDKGPSWEYPHCKIGEASDGILGHQENQDHTSQGALGYRRGPFVGLPCKVLTSWWGAKSEEQGGHWHWGGLLLCDDNPQVFHGSPQHFELPGTKHLDNSGRPSTPLVVLWCHRAFIESVPWQEPGANTLDVYNITETSDIEKSSGAR